MPSPPTEDEIAKVAGILVGSFDSFQLGTIIAEVFPRGTTVYNLGTFSESVNHTLDLAVRQHRFAELSTSILHFPSLLTELDRVSLESIRSRLPANRSVRFTDSTISGPCDIHSGNLFEVSGQFEPTTATDAPRDQYSLSVSLLASPGWGYDANSARLEFGLSRIAITVKPIAGRPLVETIRDTTNAGPFALKGDDRTTIERTVADADGCVTWAVAATHPPVDLPFLTGDLMRRHDRADRTHCPLIDFDGATNAPGTPVSAEVRAKTDAIHVEIHPYGGSALEKATPAELWERRLIAEQIVRECVPSAVLMVELPVGRETD